MSNSATESEMKVTAVANWFGCARSVRDLIGKQLAGLSHITVPFAGGMSELRVMDAKKFVVNDLHLHVINLARVMGDRELGPMLYRRLRRAVFHPDELNRAQERCRLRAAADSMQLRGLFNGGDLAEPISPPDALEWALDYFICSWMGRGGKAGSKGEFKGDLPIRFSPGGGGSAQRFQSAASSIPAWRRILKLCEFSTDDGLEIIAAANDSPLCGIYADAPWPDAGEEYRHNFTERQQRQLARALSRFKETRVVIRYGDHPLIRELYPETNWRWLMQEGRAQSNNTVPEVVIVRNK